MNCKRQRTASLLLSFETYVGDEKLLTIINTRDNGLALRDEVIVQDVIRQQAHFCISHTHTLRLIAKTKFQMVFGLSCSALVKQNFIFFSLLK